MNYVFAVDDTLPQHGGGGYHVSSLLPSPLLSSSYLGRLNLSEVYLAGVGEALQQHPQGEAKGIKAHFSMDESGLLNITNVSELLCENLQFQCSDKIGKEYHSLCIFIV